MNNVSRESAVIAQVIQLLRKPKTSSATRVQDLYVHLFENRALPGNQFSFNGLNDWAIDDLTRAFDVVMEIIAQYTWHFSDPRSIPVTYYKRERRVRRHLDQQFSALFKELIRRSGKVLEAELITEEPIYYLTKMSREKRFPKSKDGRASLMILRSRLQLELSHRIETSPASQRVYLPYEIK